MRRFITLALAFSAVIIVIGCGKKTAVVRPITPLPDVEAALIPDGGAELELLNAGYRSDSNCFQIVVRNQTRALEVSEGVCTSNPSPLLSLRVTAQSDVLMNGTVVGSFDLKNGNRLLELCSGRYLGLCHFKIQSNRVTGLQP